MALKLLGKNLEAIHWKLAIAVRDHED